MKRFWILSLVVILSACVNLGDKGSLSEEEVAAQKAEQLRQEEAARVEKERARYDAMTDEERARYDAMTDEERARYDAMTDEERAQEADEHKREAARIEEERQEQARVEEERRREEVRRQSEIAQIEALRQQRLEDDDDPSLIGMVTEEELRESNPLLLEQSIYYDYDQYSVRTEYAPFIAAHARFLVAHPTVKIFVEGNCDDRGSPEYNIALGQRRSDSVERALLSLGVPPRQIESVSFGAERPVAFGQNEDAWARNRRSDIAYPMLKY